MQSKLLNILLPAVALGSVSSLLAVVSPLTQPSYAGGSKFFCEQEGGVPVTKIRSSRGNEPFIRWVVKDLSFSPAKRCQIVSSKFQRYYDNGSLFITSGKFNNYPVLCIANRKGERCTKDNILVTLKPGTDTGAVLQRMLDFRRGVGGTVIPLSGCQAFTYDEDDVYLNVNELVDGKSCGQ